MLADAMIAAAGGSAAALKRVKDLEGAAEALVSRGRAAWPRVVVEPVAFVRHVATRLAEEEPAGDLADLHAEDLYLAFASGNGDRAAVSALDKQLRPVVEAALSRMKGKVSVEDVAQVLREKLLVARGGAAPKILDYGGRGPLAGWIRIAAIRTALSSTRHGDAAGMQPVTREALLAIPATSSDPELAHLRRRYAREFKRAFEDALAALDAEDRNLLRLSLVDGLSIDEIGTVFGVHRATAARRVARARELVQERTRKILKERLALGAAELRSIMGYIQSHLDLSIHRLLASDGPVDLGQASEAKPTRGRAKGAGPKAHAAKPTRRAPR